MENEHIGVDCTMFELFHNENFKQWNQLSFQHVLYDNDFLKGTEIGLKSEDFIGSLAIKIYSKIPNSILRYLL